MLEKLRRPRCFLDVEIDGENVGRVVVELFSDVCPLTCENFRALCTGEKGIGATTKLSLHYKNVPFHRVIKNFIIQSGDFVSGSGTGGESIYGGQFKDENFTLKHDAPFLLSMANRGKDTNSSQFFILTQPASHLDGKHTVFGRVISGSDIVSKIESQKTDSNAKPVTDCRISNCGELVLQAKVKSKKKEYPSSESEVEEKVKKHKKKRTHEKKRKEIPEKREFPHVEEADCTVLAAEIPEVPVHNFLMRRTSPKPDGNRRLNRSYERNSDRYSRQPVVTRSGRKIKGRGARRYRTPSPTASRSGSETPPHWKKEQKRMTNLGDVMAKMRELQDDDEKEIDKHVESEVHAESYRENENQGRSREGASWKRNNSDFRPENEDKFQRRGYEQRFVPEGADSRPSRQRGDFGSPRRRRFRESNSRGGHFEPLGNEEDVDEHRSSPVRSMVFKPAEIRKDFKENSRQEDNNRDRRPAEHRSRYEDRGHREVQKSRHDSKRSKTREEDDKNKKGDDSTKHAFKTIKIDTMDASKKQQMRSFGISLLNYSGLRKVKPNQDKNKEVTSKKKKSEEEERSEKKRPHDQKTKEDAKSIPKEVVKPSAQVNIDEQELSVLSKMKDDLQKQLAKEDLRGSQSPMAVSAKKRKERSDGPTDMAHITVAVTTTTTHDKPGKEDRAKNSVQSEKESHWIEEVDLQKISKAGMITDSVFIKEEPSATNVDHHDSNQSMRDYVYPFIIPLPDEITPTPQSKVGTGDDNYKEKTIKLEPELSPESYFGKQKSKWEEEVQESAAVVSSGLLSSRAEKSALPNSSKDIAEKGSTSPSQTQRSQLSDSPEGVRKVAKGVELAKLRRDIHKEGRFTPPKRRSSSRSPSPGTSSRKAKPSTTNERMRSPVHSRRPRSPARRSRSPDRRSRSPVRRRSRSPIRRRSRSPVRQRSRSPVRQRSRSPVRQRSRSPVRRRSRSPRSRSRSPRGRPRYSRSPDRGYRSRNYGRPRGSYARNRRYSRDDRPERGARRDRRSRSTSRDDRKREGKRRASRSSSSSRSSRSSSASSTGHRHPSKKTKRKSLSRSSRSSHSDSA